MSLKVPESTEGLVYITNRFLDNDGQVMCWVEKKLCPKCKQATMGKPLGPEGKPKIRAKEYVCQKCQYTEEKKAYEESLTANIIYTCPKCKHHSELQMPFKRKKIQGADALIFLCQKCGEKIYITKKMKEIGEKDA